MVDNVLLFDYTCKNIIVKQGSRSTLQYVLEPLLI